MEESIKDTFKVVVLGEGKYSEVLGREGVSVWEADC